MQEKQDMCVINDPLGQDPQSRLSNDHYSHLKFDPLGRPTVTAGRDNCFSTCCPSVRPHFSKSRKTKQSENNVRYWRVCRSGRGDN